MNSILQALTFAIALITSLVSAIQPPIEQIVKKDGVLIFSKINCPYCVKAKDLLKARNIAYEAIELDHFTNPAPFVAKLIEYTNQRTVPNIFINGQHIGGFDSLSQKDSSGELSKLTSQQEKRKL